MLKFPYFARLITLLFLFTAIGLLYDFYVPLFEKPDELKHFAVIQFMQSHHALPIVVEGIYEPWDQEGTQPPFYHLIAAAATQWLDLSHFSEPPRNPHYVDERSFVWRERGNNNLYLHTPDENRTFTPTLIAARIARWLSLFYGLITLSLTYALAQLVLGRDDQALLATALVAFIPQFLHTSTAISNDGLSTTLATAALWLLARQLQTPTLRHLIGLGVVLGLGAITKLSLLYLLPLVALALSYRHFQQGHPKSIVHDGLILATFVTLIAGGWYLRNWLVYGDPTALNAHLLYRGGPLTPTPTLAEIYQTELTGLELSFWAAFGAGQILWETWIYTALRGIKYIVFIGLVMGLIRRQVAPQINHTLLIWLTLWVMIIFIALLRWMQITPASWGRLLFPALPAGAIVAVWALGQFRVKSNDLDSLLDSTRVGSGVTKLALWYKVNFVTPLTAQFQPVLSIPLILATCLFILALISPFRYLQTTYAHAPLMNETALPANRQPIDLTYADSMRLMGYQVATNTVKPGDWLPVTLYWQTTRPMTQNYSVFIHLLTQSAEPTVVGQVNTYPNHGNWPTSQLPVGAVLADTYYVPITAEAQAPAVIQLAIGLFEFDDPQRAAKPAINRQGESVQPIVEAIPLIPHTWPIFTPTHPLDLTFGNQIQLTGYNVMTTTAQAGETIPLTLYWQSLKSSQQNLTLFIQLVDSTTRQQVAGFDAPPYFPTRFWSTETRLIDPRPLTLPADLPPGDYMLLIGWYQPDTGARLTLQNHPDGAFPLLTLTVTTD